MKKSKLSNIILCIAIIAALCVAPFAPSAEAAPFLPFSSPTQTTAAQTSTQVRHIILNVGAPEIIIDGVTSRLSAPPVVISGTTLVPLRAIFEALSTEVHWSSGNITARNENTEIKLTVGSTTAYRNGTPITLSVAPQLIDGRTMVPLRFIAESLGAEVQWIQSTRTIRIAMVPDGAQYVRLGDARIFMGDPLDHVRAILGRSDSVEQSAHDFDWHVYSSDYSRFLLVGIKDRRVVALYTNSTGFETVGAKYGDAGASMSYRMEGNAVRFLDDAIPAPGIKLFVSEGKVYAVRILPEVLVDKTSFSNEFYRSQERLLFHITNAYRASQGLSVLMYDDAAAIAGRNHCKDMVVRNYFSHITPEGVNLVQRYNTAGGVGVRIGEALGRVETHSMLGIDTFNGIMNSVGHKQLMDRPEHDHLGTGVHETHMALVFAGHY